MSTVRDDIVREIREYMPGADGAADARTIADALIARFPHLTQKQEIEWGWRSFFEDGEEYEWLNCASREEAEQQIRDLQEEEDRISANENATGSRLTYSLWSRTKGVAGPWVAADGTTSR